MNGNNSHPSRSRLSPFEGRILSGGTLLRRNYSLMIPPVLLMETLADLRKADDIETGQAEVQRLASID